MTRTGTDRRGPRQAAAAAAAAMVLGLAAATALVSASSSSSSSIPAASAFAPPSPARPLRPFVASPSSSSKATTVLRASAPAPDGGDPAEEGEDDAAFCDVNEDFDSYSRCLSPRELRDDVMKEEGRYAIVDRIPGWQRALGFPARAARKVASKLKVGGKAVTKPGALILVRCGESTWNANQTFTGWADPDLSPTGIKEIEHAGRLLLAEGYEPDVVYTSRLKRAIHSVWFMLRTVKSTYLPVYKSWRLNERMYGALQGLSKKETARRLGSDVVQAWRNSLKARPPPVKTTDPNYPGNDPRYADLTEDQIPRSESLLDTMERAKPLWEYKISKEIAKGNNVMVLAHCNTLRGLMKVIDGISDDDIKDVTMPTAIPFVYRFDEQMNPLKPVDDSLSQVHTSGFFLEKPGLLKEALQRQEDWEDFVPGFDSAERVKPQRAVGLEEELATLRREQEDEEWVEKFGGGVDSSDGIKLVNGGTSTAASVMNGAKAKFTDDPSEFEDWDVDPEFAGEEQEFFVTTTPLPQESSEESVSPSRTPAVGLSAQSQDGPVVVLIRHGRTPHNNLGLFTGWEDPPLAPDGVEDAKEAGRLLRRHGFKFDVVYSSWLTRAIDTAWYVLDELDLMWLPIVKSWRLNERMYGALTGKSKKMIANEYGEEQLKKWRRGFTIQPPATSSYSLSYPGNDYRRTKYVKDIRISVRETLFRSIESRKLQVHRKFPKTESLKDCMDRSIPFYTERIVPEAVNKGKRVLITSHENAIRGILMHLCEIPPEAMNQLHLPNGLPLVYNVRGRCISLLDDGSGQDPMEKHDFGPAAKYLFKPCELDDSFFEEMEAKAEKSKEEEKVAA